MKKMIFLIPLLLIAMVGMAQTKASGYFSAAGAAADTLTASATKSYTFDFRDIATKDGGVDLQIWTDLVSGTATFGYKYWWSNDGVNWPATAADSIAAAKSHASDYVKMINIDSLAGRYLKISLIATSATQKSKIYLYGRSYVKN